MSKAHMFSCREAISINQGHYRAYKLLGSALYALGDLGAAEHALQQSLAINPNYSDASCDLGAFSLASQTGVPSLTTFSASNWEAAPPHCDTVGLHC